MNNIPNIDTFLNGTKDKIISDFSIRRLEMLDILAKEEYGYLPKIFGQTEYDIIEQTEKQYCAGHANTKKINIIIPAQKGKFTFPITLITPCNVKKAPLFLFINFNQSEYNKYFPMEEIIDKGFAVAYIYYNHITSDDNNFNDGLPSYYESAGESSPGKISYWAFAISRTLDILQNFDEIDNTEIAVIGHSRLGKTALWCGANDERIKYVVSNCSGCCGAALEKTKHNNAETYEAIINRFPYWFCKNFHKYRDSLNIPPFDQHFLLSCIAPRYLFVGSATNDLWADPYSEKLCCAGASSAFEICGVKGYIGNVNEPILCNNDNIFTNMIIENNNEGHIKYHLRHGEHFLSRNDWNVYMEDISNVIRKNR